MSVVPDFLRLRAPETSPSIVGHQPAVHSAGATDRLWLLDVLRGAAAHVIVWHHLAFYWPPADSAHPLVLGVNDWLAEYGRCAVQVFFVISGFVAASRLGRRAIKDWRDAIDVVGQRYVRLAGPYLVALQLAILANWLAGQWSEHHAIADPPTIPQYLAHVVLLQDLLEYEALSAGVWYLAIDMQLTVLFVLMRLFARRLSSGVGLSPQTAFQLIAWPLAAASLFWFNRDPAWDRWAIYFFGSYGLGLTAAWAQSSGRKWSFWAYAAMIVLALVVEWRVRLAVALASGLIVHVGGRWEWVSSISDSRWLRTAAQTSYSLFLVHFPVSLLVQAGLSQLAADSPAWSCAGLLTAYALSVAAATAFYFGVERRLCAVRLGRTERR